MSTKRIEAGPTLPTERNWDREEFAHTAAPLSAQMALTVLIVDAPNTDAPAAFNCPTRSSVEIDAFTASLDKH